MKIKFLIASAAVGMALSTAAMAQSFPPPNLCQMYARDLNQNIMLMVGSDKVDPASQALTEGTDQCARGLYDDGINTLTTAIRDMGLPVNEY